MNLNRDVYKYDKLNEEAFVSIFTAITNFQKSLSNRCHRGYEDTIARIIREQLEVIFYKMLVNQMTTEDKDSPKIHSIILSWGLYGASVEWKRTGMTIPPEEFIKSAIPYLLSGIELDINN